MPQITVNEIDQSVVTRVVSDDRVKILVPAILSFGPAFDGTADSVMTFTDVTDFNRKCGYTEAEFDPFTDDKSRIYARELIKRGAAVSVVRVNNDGQISSFDIGTSTIIPKAVEPSIPQQLVELTDSIAHTQEGSLFKFNLNDGYILPSTLSCTLNYSSAQPEPSELSDDSHGNIIFSNITDGSLTGTIDYATGLIVIKTETSGIYPSTLENVKYSKGTIATTDMYKYTFCPQINGIEAKYPGSFGNNLYMSISQITTKNVAEAYQYANISVYYMDVKTNYNDDGTVSSRVVKSVTQLETRRVSTNPNDPYYFEDVEFEFIRIIPVPGAREELSLVWSDIEASPQSNHRYSGFPTILLKYNKNNISYYNFDCGFDGGCDFAYSQDVLDKLRKGFKGYTPGDNWTIEDVNKYMEDVYGVDGNSGIVASIYANITNTYANFTDPYIYDFDFITSGGFTYKEFKIGEVTSVKMYTSLTATTISTAITSDSVPIKKGTVKVTAFNSEDTDPVEYTDDSEGSIKNGATTIAYIDYITGKIYVSNSTPLEGKTLALSYEYFANTVTSTDYDNTSKTLANTPVTEGSVRVTVTATGEDPTTTYYSDYYGDGKLYVTTFDHDVAMKPATTTSSGTIDYDTGVITSTTIPTGNTVTVSYRANSSAVVPSVVVPTSDGNASYYLGINPIHQAMLNLVETRQDCIALFDVPADYDKNAIIDYSGMLNTSYGTMHFPWCYVASPDYA